MSRICHLNNLAGQNNIYNAHDESESDYFKGSCIIENVSSYSQQYFNRKKLRTSFACSFGR